MSHVRFAFIVVSLWLSNSAGAQTQIHKCTDADGGVVYSQLPCPPEAPVEPESTEPDVIAENSPAVAEQPPASTTEVLYEDPELEPDRQACKKRYRDAIDAIDVEIGREYSPDKAADYKQRLLILTRKLRQC